MNKILLINPPYIGNILAGQTWHPTGILSLGSFMETKGYNVHLIDGVVDKKANQKIDSFLEDKTLTIIGFTVMTSQIKYVLPIAEKIRKKRPDIVIIFGGIHPTLFPEKTIEHPNVDICVFGEGENTLLEICELLIDSNGSIKAEEKIDKAKDKLVDVKGLVFQKDGKCVNTGIRKPIDLNELPFFNYRLLGLEPYINQDYRIYGSTKRRALILNSSRGCPYRCAFCINIVGPKRFYRAKKAERILEEIDFLVKEYNINHIDFVDEEFFGIRKRTYKIIEGLEQRAYDLTWCVGTRANYFDPKEDYMTPEFVKRVHKAGCIRWALGVESGSDRMLKLLNKEITKEQVLMAAKTCKDIGINTAYGFMMGMPSETREDMIDTLKLLNDLMTTYPKNSFVVGPTIYRPYPGTKLYEECVKHGLWEPSSLDEWKDNLDETIDTIEVGEKTPWIKDPHFVKLASYLASQAFSEGLRRQGKLHQFISVFFRKAAFKRIEHNFYKFPIDYMVHELIKKLVIRIKHLKHRT
jgi:anaerobic magnesium-protoporphyrin IX monomethyl ester cyclase